MAQRLDCTNADRLFQTNRGQTRSKLGLLVLLAKLHLRCLEQIENGNRNRFPRGQETILFEKIQNQLRTMKNDMVQLDPKSLNFIGISMQDYQRNIDIDVDFSRFLMKSLLLSCHAILQNNEAGKQKIKDRLTLQERIPLDPALFADRRADIERYLNVRRDTNSLNRIHSIIDSFADVIVEGKEFKIEEKRLMAERIFYTIGEYMKSTENTPNLSPETARRLEEHIPVPVLTKFRNDLSHHQVFPLLGIDEKKLSDLNLEVFSLILSSVRDAIISTEKAFIQEVVTRNLPQVVGNNVRKGLSDTSKQGVRELIQYIEEIKQNRGAYHALNPRSKRSIDEIYKNALQMKSRDFTVNDKAYIIVSKLNKMAEAFRESIKSEEDTKLEKYERLRVMNLPVEAHEDLIRITKFLCFLEKCPSGHTFEPLLDNFLKDTKVLGRIYNKDGSSLLQRLRPYYDPAALRSFKTYNHEKAESLAELLPEVRGNIQDRKRLTNFIESVKKMKNLEENYIPADEYEELVKDLNMRAEVKEKFLLFSNEWRKKRCVDLLKNEPPAAAAIYEDIANARDTNLGVFKRLFTEYPPANQNPTAVKQTIDRLRNGIDNQLRDLYEARVTDEVKVLKYLSDPHAVKAQFIHIYSLLDMYDRGSHPNFRLLRNYLSHGNAMLGGEEDRASAEVLVDLKNNVLSFIDDEQIGVKGVRGLLNFLESDAALDMIPANVRKLLCVSNRSRRPARSVSDAGCLQWDEIDEINESGPENRNFDDMVIDTDKFIDKLSNEFDVNMEKFTSLLALASETKVSGIYSEKVGWLVENHKFTGHLEKVGKFSGFVMHGLIAKDIIGDLLRGDFKDAAFNVGFLGGSIGLSKFAQTVAKRGAGLVLEGRAVLGNSLRLAGPVMSRGVSAFVAFDLYNQVKEYKAGNKDALVSIVGDSVQLGVDAIEMGVEIGGALGLESLAAASAVTGPVGMAVGAVIFLGTQIYSAVRKVDKLDEQVHLTGWEKLGQGFLAFFGASPSQYLQNLAEEKESNNLAVGNTVIFLKSNPHIRRYVFPSFKIRDTNDNQERDPNPIFSNLDLSKVNPVLDSVVDFDEKINYIKWARYRPEKRGDSDLFCLPTGDWESVPQSGTYYCKGAIGVDYSDANTTGNDTLISLGFGTDMAYGFPESSNIFVLHKGNKNMRGGKKNDYFVFQNMLPITGSISGYSGVDTVDVSGLKCTSDSKEGKCHILADFSKGTLKDSTGSFNVAMVNINQFIGTQNGMDGVFAACDTNYIDGKGGLDENQLDKIVIPKDDNCSYQMTIMVNPYTNVTNHGRIGEFTHYVVKGSPWSQTYVELNPDPKHVHHSFAFNYTLEDIASIERTAANVTNISFINNFHKTKKDVEVKTRLAFFYSYRNSIRNATYNVTIANAHKSTTQYQLLDSAQLLVGKNNIYAIQNTKRPIKDLIQDYYSIASKTHMYVFVHSNNEILTIGNHNHNILSNDPSARRTYLVGGGGQNVFAISSGYPVLSRGKLPLSEVVIYDLDTKDDTNTIDLRQITKQLKADLKGEIETHIMQNDGDLHLTVSLVGSPKQEVITIRLAGALKDDWYSRVHVVTESVFLIEGNRGSFKLIPKPLIFDDSSINIFVIDPTEVAEGNRIEVNKTITDYRFARDDDALVITNSLRVDADKSNPVTMIIKEFYNKEKMKTLQIDFKDKTIELTEEMPQIRAAGNFKGLSQEIIFNSYKALVDSLREEMFFESISEGNVKRFNELLDRKVNPNCLKEWDGHGRKPIHIAVLKQRKDMVDSLLKRGVSINESDGNDWTPLHWAAYKGLNEMATYLVSKGADINARESLGRSPLELVQRFIASHSIEPETSKRYLDVVRFLQESAKLDRKLANILGERSIDFEVAESLIDSGADINTRNYMGQTILHFAVLTDNETLVRSLIRKGANVNAQDDLMNTPLHYFILEKPTNSSITIPRQLVASGADLKALNSYARTPLHLATLSHWPELVAYFVTRGGDYNMSDTYGDTPLCLATKRGYDDIVKYFNYTSSRKRPYRSIYADSENNPEISVGSSASMPISLVNDLFGWVHKGATGIKSLAYSWLPDFIALPNAETHLLDGTPLLASKPSANSSNFHSAQIDTNGTILLLDTFIRKTTGQKYPTSYERQMSELEATGYAINITEKFEKILKRAMRKIKIPISRFDIDFANIQGNIKRKILSGNFHEIVGILDLELKVISDHSETSEVDRAEFRKFTEDIAESIDIFLNRSISKILGQGKCNLSCEAHSSYHRNVTLIKNNNNQNARSIERKIHEIK